MTQERPRSIRKEKGQYFADIVQSVEAGYEHIFVWIVQKQGFPEVLRLGQADSLEEAERTVDSVLQELASEDPPRGKKAHL